MMKRMRVQGPVDAAISLPLELPPAISICVVFCCAAFIPSHMTIPGQGDRTEEAPNTLMTVREEMIKCRGYHLGLGLGVSEAGFSGGQHTGA